ncbi:MAG: CHAT domain-containing protein [Betaproteobacteria bacterium]|nr:MAG: CHAT domain-containing protein [Betaproteobacteria bacterium]
MAQRSYTIRGTSAAPTTLDVRKGIGVSNPRRITPGRARDGVTDEIQVAADDIVRIELENEFVLWSRADSLIREHGRPTLSRDGVAAWEFDTVVSDRGAAAARGERGLAGLGIRVLEFFGIDLAQQTASKLATWFEDKQLGKDGPGLFRCPLDGTFGLHKLGAKQAVTATPSALIFLHGTASSTQGSFGKLWDPANDAGGKLRARLAKDYGERVFAFEHRSLTESPIENALALAGELPKGAKLHLVSHSRGGLVGELLCLAGCERADELLTEAGLKTLFEADRTIAPQLGLSPLDKDAAEAHRAAYDKDRALLVKLRKLLRTRDIVVERFVRVACPARGTTLASGRLDRWLSVLGFVAKRAAGHELFGDGLDFLLAVVKERTDPRTLPGLEAMMPGSALTRLLHHPDLVTTADLSVIAGDIEGDSLWQKIKLVAADWFYGADHDLVVNTGSMSGGLRRLPGGARFRADKGAEVNHFSYFKNARSIQWLEAGLTRDKDETGGFLPIDAAPQTPPRWRDAVQRSRAGDTPRPLAVVLPGTMGSELSVDGDRVWLNYWSLLRGGLKRIASGARNVAPGELVDDFYGPLLEFLAHTHRVEIFPYDWRMSVTAAAGKLAQRLADWLPAAERQGQPVHIVAHSMGGLVVRAMIADGGAGAGLWERIRRLPNSRFLMLGTPNLGSHEAVRWLTGFNPTQAKLALLDFTQDTDDIIDIVGNYPGLLELLPFADEALPFARQEPWDTIRKETRAGWNTASAALLRDAARTWQRLRGAAPDPLMRYVAGCQPATVIDYRLVADETLGRHGSKRIEFLATREGDGTVSWASGRLRDVPTWYVEDTAHDALCTQKRAFAAYLELLQTGATKRLPATPPARARAAEGEGAVFVLPQTPPADGVPGERDVARLGFGGTLPAEDDGRPPIPGITVSIRHGDLTYARHPVLVGHYLGDTIVSAEKVLDKRLGNALSRRHFLGLYPGRLHTHALFFHPRREGRPGGAIVIGLGQVGELTPGLLEAATRSALLDYALQVAQWADDRFGPAGSPRRASVSCLLVGTGAGGMPVRDSIEAMLRGAVAANARLVEAELDNQVTIAEIEFLELYEDVAINAVDGLTQILGDGELAATVNWPACQVEAGVGGHRRVRFDEAPEWWHRLEIVEEEGRRDVLRFVFATDRARAEETLSTGQLALADAFVRSASRTAKANPEAARTLFEMLLPLRLREMAPRQSDLVLLVDERSARYPWELLEDRWSANGRPPAVACGLVRQLKTQTFRPRPAHPFEARALVIGHPDLQGWDRFSDLPGARDEAHRVADILSGSDFRVTDCIDETTDAIVENLHRDAWRILHLAGHGEHEFEIPLPPACPGAQPGTGPVATPVEGLKPAVRKVSGMVIGKEVFLTPGDIEQMRWVPELVFINCCHLGKTTSTLPPDRGALAANLGVQFIRMGVRAVVAAGWAVDDGAALAFAETFYKRMLSGDAFGEAVRAAREETWRRFPSVNTWGAYQCYGDPAYRLRRDTASRPRPRTPYATPSELVADLDNLARTLQAGAPDDETPAAIEARLARIPDTQRDKWLKLAEVCAAIGFAWGEARHWNEAIEWLERALDADKGQCPMRAAEQRANYIVRRAADQWLALRGSNPTDDEHAALIKTVQDALDDLERLRQSGATEERLNLLGSACKRRALIETDADRRRAALREAARYYELAWERGRRDKAYAFTNWAGACLLAGPRDDEAAGPTWAAQFDADLARLTETTQQRNAADPNFWDAASLGDLALGRLIASCPPWAAAQASAGAPGPVDEGLVDAVIAAYRAALERGASPRERASVIENLDFVLEFAGRAGTPLAAALQRIRDAL